MDINKYLIHFEGTFWGKSYDDSFPPGRFFNNSNKCKKFISFVTNTLLERLQNGSIECLGKVGEVQPPHIVAPLTVEPTKPRLCINLMYLNNWIKAMPFSLDTLKDVPRSVRENAYFTTIDDKSGFDNVSISQNSKKFVGFQWANYYFVFNTLPFGFKLSSYIYHSLNLSVVSYIRREFLIPIHLYIDDRLVEEVRKSGLGTGFNNAKMANYIVCEILTRLGYCINLEKTKFTPSQSVTFLGFIVDSVDKCFRVTETKKHKFMILREECLSKKVVSVLNLQKLVGRCISFMLAVPAAKLYTRCMNYAISNGIRAQAGVQMNKELTEEISHWRFLDEWMGKLEWKKEKHLSVNIYTDASTYKWGGFLKINETEYMVGDSWTDELLSLPIVVLEAKALANVLKAVKEVIKGHRVDANVDNQALIGAWNNEGSRSPLLNSVLKEIFQLTLELDIVLNLSFVPSKSNLADEPSRKINKSDATLTREVWVTIQEYFGEVSGHTLDLMALDSNSMTDHKGRSLKHFTPGFSPNSSGVNLFAQTIEKKENCYVFPPFSLLTPVLCFIKENELTCTVVLRSSEVTPSWVPTYFELIKDAFVIGFKGQEKILKYPTKKGYVVDRLGLPDNLWAVRIQRNPYPGITYGKWLFQNYPAISKAFNLLCIGDSMIRFMLYLKDFNNPMVHVFSHSGALLKLLIRWRDCLWFTHRELFLYMLVLTI